MSMSRTLPFCFGLLVVALSCDRDRHLVGIDPGPDGAGQISPGEADAGPPSPPVYPTRDTPLPDCPAYPTLAKMDRFFDRRCSDSNANCHGIGTPWTALSQPDLFLLLLDKNSKLDCIGDKIISSANPLVSLLYIKSAQAMPVCPSAKSTAGTVMPPPAGTAFGDLHYPPLTAEEVVCVEQFVKAAATGAAR